MIVAKTDVKKMPSGCTVCEYGYNEIDTDGGFGLLRCELDGLADVDVNYLSRGDNCPLIEISDAVLAEGEVEA